MILTTRILKMILSERYWIFDGEMEDLDNIESRIKNIEFTSKYSIILSPKLRRKIIFLFKNKQGVYFRYRPEFGFFKISGYYLKIGYNKNQKKLIVEEKIVEPARSFLIFFVVFNFLYYFILIFRLFYSVFDKEAWVLTFIESVPLFIIPLINIGFICLLCKYVFWRSREERNVLDSTVISILQA